MEKIVVKRELDEDIGHYRKCLSFLEANAPISVLCLPSAIETILEREGFEYVYDLLGKQLTEIKGLGPRRCAILAARLDEFLSMSI